MNRNYPHFAIPEIYGESLSYYELLRKLVKAMNIVIENYDTIPDQIAEAVANLDVSQLFNAVLAQLIDSIATDNTKSTNAVKVYKKHDLLYATFNDTVNLYEALIDFTTGTETELIIGTNIREVNISELFIELRELIDNEAQAREQDDQTLQQAINTEKSAREQADHTLQQSINTEKSAREQADQTLQEAINTEKSAREQADQTLQQSINTEKSAREQSDQNINNKIININVPRIIGDSQQSNEVSFIPSNIGTGVFVIYAEGGSDVLGLLMITSSSNFRILYAGNNNEFVSENGASSQTVTVNLGAWYRKLMARQIA